VIVVGAGAFGGWTALQLLKRGAKVTLLDAWGPGNSRASSGGETRVIRATYGSGRVYTQMAARALQLWPEYEKQWHLKLLFRSGVLWMAGADDAYERAALPLLSEAGVRFDSFSAAECARRWPQINFEGISWAVYEPDSGYLAARRACEAVLNAFINEGGEYRQAQVAPGAIASNQMNDVKLGSGETLSADSYVFACGPWLGKVFSFLSATITPTRQEVFFFGTAAGDLRFTDAQLPVWSDDSKRDLDGPESVGFTVSLEIAGVVSSSPMILAARSSIRPPWSARFPAKVSQPRAPIYVFAFHSSPMRHWLTVAYANTKTQPIRILFWTAILRQEMFGSSVEDRVTDSSMDQHSERW
jgi:FAD dependent oxidoreductase